jgi:hypothetical protein
MPICTTSGSVVHLGLSTESRLVHIREVERQGWALKRENEPEVVPL